ncbi:alpha/beta fold hydrolase [Ideonella sp. A 288]|uniref:alpha/beta fold hydrolase n=1 Tax=Ideonella sp. A 288 TaxID=1962181 RepID=UPI001303A260|nr:alpha/beta hydrolase [Ideonella sp. A 288]
MLDGRRVEVQYARRPGPTIVLINGAGGPLDGWMRVWVPLTKLGTVVAWNRPGIGASDPPHVDQTSETVTRQLLALLAALAIPGPYVLVGHSLGGLHALHFARSHPAHIAAVVLLEATAPQDMAAMAEHASPLQRGLQALVDRWWPPQPHSEVVHARTSAAQLAGLPPFPRVPLAVVTGMRPALAWLTPGAQRAARCRHQRALVELSPPGSHVLAHRSGHFPQLSEPALVAQAISDLARAASSQPRV